MAAQLPYPQAWLWPRLEQTQAVQFAFPPPYAAWWDSSPHTDVCLRGILPLSWNLDHAGPITRKVEDAALMLQVMSGYDELDPASLKTLPGDYYSHIKDGMNERKIALAVGNFIDEAEQKFWKLFARPQKFWKHKV